MKRKKKKYYYVKLIRMKSRAITMEPVDEESRLFSSKSLATKWLIKNNFTYGQRRFFNYPANDKEWFHKDDINLEYVDVVITKIYLDDLTKSKFKNLKKIHREWLPKFLKELKETEPEEN